MNKRVALEEQGLTPAQVELALKLMSKPGRGPKPCKCGCGGMTKGGMYKPGHDAKHLSATLAEMRAMEQVAEVVLDVVEEAPTPINKKRAKKDKKVA